MAPAKPDGVPSPGKIEPRKRPTGALPSIPEFLNIFVYIAVWNLSLVSLTYPLVLLRALVNKNYVTVASILGILGVCYFPYPEGSFPLGGKTVRKKTADLLAGYFRSCAITWEEPREVEEKATLYGFHPHGIFSMAWALSFTHEDFSSAHFCFSDLLKFSPLFRIYSTILGKPSGVSKAAMTKLMRSKSDLAVILGGFEEATIHSSEVDRIYIKKRMGFVKMGLQHGYCLRAVYGIGENKMYWNSQICLKFRLALNKYGLPGIIPFGWKFLPFMPDPDTDLDIFVSRKLQLPTIENPSKEDVATWHAKYVELVCDLHERNRKKDTTKALEVW